MIDPKIRESYIATIGVECHVQFNTKTKLFAAVNNDAVGADPNTLVSHICFGLPGALPVLNEKAVEFATKAAFALNTTPQKFSQFDRKHYFYPDLPMGYQITQFNYPVIADGYININVDGNSKKINITRAHLEADAGKSSHPDGKDYSLIDLNRAGTPLLEIVSDPDMHTAAEVKAYAQELYLQMKYAGITNADLYHGNMRFDVNVSVSKDPKVLGTRSETKNLNSFRSVEKAVEYEIERQIELLEKGSRIVQETRGWNDAKQKTFSQRSKEDAHDYRYFPDPDLPPITLTDVYIDNIKSQMPVLPNDIRDELSKSGVSRVDIETLLSADNPNIKNGYISTLSQLKNDPPIVKYAANWMINRHIMHQQDSQEAVDYNLPTSSEFKTVYELQVSQNKLSSNNADLLLSDLSMLTSAGNPEELARGKGYLQMSDTGSLEAWAEEVISANDKAVDDVKNGETKAIGFLVGQIMKLSKGQANPTLSEKIIREKLNL